MHRNNSELGISFSSLLFPQLGELTELASEKTGNPFVQRFIGAMTGLQKCCANPAYLDLVFTCMCEFRNFTIEIESLDDLVHRLYNGNFPFTLARDVFFCIIPIGAVLRFLTH